MNYGCGGNASSGNMTPKYPTGEHHMGIVESRSRQERRKLQQAHQKQIDEICKYAGTERCYRFDDSLNCTRQDGIVQISNAHSVHKATMKNQLGNVLKTFGLPRTKRASSTLYSGRGPWNEHPGSASTGTWSCNEHDHVFGCIDTNHPNIEDSMVPLLIALRATLHEWWYADREFYIRTALSRCKALEVSGHAGRIHNEEEQCVHQDLHKEFLLLSQNALERAQRIRPVADRLVLQLLREEYDSIKAEKVSVPGQPTTIGTSVEVTKKGGLIVMTIIPAQHGHDIIWCWSRNAFTEVIGKTMSWATSLNHKGFITAMFLRSPYNVFVNDQYYRDDLEQHKDEIVSRISSRKMSDRLLSIRGLDFSILG